MVLRRFASASARLNSFSLRGSKKEEISNRKSILVPDVDALELHGFCDACSAKHRRYQCHHIVAESIAPCEKHLYTPNLLPGINYSAEVEQDSEQCPNCIKKHHAQKQLNEFQRVRNAKDTHFEREIGQDVLILAAFEEGRRLPREAFEAGKDEREARIEERKRIRGLPANNAQAEIDALTSEIRRYSPAPRQEAVKPLSKRRPSFEF